MLVEADHGVQWSVTKHCLASRASAAALHGADSDTISSWRWLFNFVHGARFSRTQLAHKTIQVGAAGAAVHSKLSLSLVSISLGLSVRRSAIFISGAVLTLNLRPSQSL